MKKLFSKEIMLKIRNDIPINEVIREILVLQWKMADGHLRFLCPICCDFHTATNSKTNLGRCFKCKRNFNPVDLVMAVKNWDFVRTVNTLRKVLRE